jgi:anti-sigma factor RsiW
MRMDGNSMRPDQHHISDEELIQAIDGELSDAELAGIDAHVQACISCRGRRAKIERASDDFVEAHHQSPGLPPIDNARSRLQTQLADAAVVVQQKSRRRPVPLFAYAALLLMAATLVGLVLHFRIVGVGAASIPDAELTPGAMHSVTREDVCASPTRDDSEPVPSSLASTVFEKYGIDNPQPRAYEVDHLITPALGGSTDIRNLWPQPYSDGTWNARVKDALEDHLHRLVCDGELELSTAQSDISADWIAAYKKYFRTDEPLLDHFAFIKDSPWE